MKKILLTIFIVFTTFKSVEATEGRIYFLGQPRAGNHFASYVIAKVLNLPCISHPTQEPFLWVSPDWQGKIDAKIEGNVNLSQEAIDQVAMKATTMVGALLAQMSESDGSSFVKNAIAKVSGIPGRNRDLAKRTPNRFV